MSCREEAVLIRRISDVDMAYRLSFFTSCFKQKLGDDVYMYGMGAAFAVSEFHNMTEDRDHHIAVLFLFADPVCHNIRKLSLLCVQGYGILDTPLNNGGFKGTADIILLHPGRMPL